MSPIATLKALLKAAARSETIFFVDEASFQNDRKNLPNGCVGYKVVPTAGVKDLEALMKACVNKAGKKMLGSYTLSSRDPATPKAVVIYFTKTMMCRWSDGSSNLPAAVLAMVPRFTDSNATCDVANDDDEPATEAPADE